MTKHCVYCGAVHEKRGYFCSPECHKAYRKARRDEKAQKVCRLCGRSLPRAKRQEPQSEAVRTAHRALDYPLPPAEIA